MEIIEGFGTAIKDEVHEIREKLNGPNSALVYIKKLGKHVHFD